MKGDEKEGYGQAGMGNKKNGPQAGHIEGSVFWTLLFGGLIVIPKSGTRAASFSSPNLAWGVA